MSRHPSLVWFTTCFSILAGARPKITAAASGKNDARPGDGFKDSAPRAPGPDLRGGRPGDGGELGYALVRIRERRRDIGTRRGYVDPSGDRVEAERVFGGAWVGFLCGAVVVLGSELGLQAKLFEQVAV